MQPLLKLVHDADRRRSARRDQIAPSTRWLEPQRLVAAVHYVVTHADPGKLGYVKLNRTLWYSDLEHYRWHGKSITGLAHYTRTMQGPMADDISRAIVRLAKEGKVAEMTVRVDDYQRREMVCLRAPDISGFTAEQIEILFRMTKFVAPLTAQRLSRITHDDPLWKELKNNEPMAIATGSVITRSPLSA